MNWGKIATAGTLALVLAGCAGKIIQEKMLPMIGQPASSVFAKLGLPDAEGEVAGGKFYVWGTQATGAYTFYSYTTFYNYSCKIRVFVDSQDRITTYDFKGNGCKTFAKQLSR